MDSHCSYLERSLLWRISRTATLRLYKKNLVLRSGAALDNLIRNTRSLAHVHTHHTSPRKHPQQAGSDTRSLSFRARSK